MKPSNPRREGGKKGRREGGTREREREGRERWRERTRGRDIWDGGMGCDSNYEVGAYGMEWVHNREPERSRVTS